jgi:predicted PurR-regulated permease PerM
VSTGPGELRRIRNRIPGIVWLVIGVVLALALFYLAPLILGRFTRVHPLLLIFATLLGASLFGLIGMFLAAPVTALAKETFLFTMERVQARREAARLGVSA